MDNKDNNSEEKEQNNQENNESFDEIEIKEDIPDFLESNSEYEIPNEVIEEESIEEKKERIKFATKDSRKFRRKKTFAQAEFIEPNEHERSIVVSGLTEFYKNNPQFLKNGESIEKKIEDIILECSKGWICAAKNFIKRVEWKTKWNCPSLEKRFDYKENFSNAKQIQLQKDLKKLETSTKVSQTSSATDLRKIIPSPEERKYWSEREAKYRGEFEFNDSSDWPLLLQVLLEELTQWRLVRKRIINPDEDVEVLITNSYQRMIKAQEALGITRKQREEAQNETEGNIGQLAKQYEEKKEIIDKIREKDKLEEEARMRDHDNRSGLDLLPDDLAEALRNVNEISDLVDIQDEINKASDGKNNKETNDDDDEDMLTV